MTHLLRCLTRQLLDVPSSTPASRLARRPRIWDHSHHPFVFSFVLLILVFSCFFAGCVRSVEGVKSHKKSLDPIEVQGGATIPYYGFSIDVSYDDRLDHLVTGYKLLNVAVSNTSPFVVPMNSEKDIWYVVDSHGRKYRLVNSIRFKDPKLWRELPSELRHKMEYAESVPVSYGVTFNLLIPQKVDMEKFEEVHYFNAQWKRLFVITKY